MWNVGWTGKGKWVCLEKGQGVYRIARKRKWFCSFAWKNEKEFVGLPEQGKCVCRFASKKGSMWDVGWRGKRKMGLSVNKLF